MVKSQAIVRAPEALGGALPAQQETQTQPQTVSGSQAQTVEPSSTEPSASQQSPFTADNIQNAILQDMQNGGKNVAALVSLYNAFGKPQSVTTIKPTSQQVGVAQSGEQSLQNLQSMITQNPNVVNKSAVPGSGLPIVGGFLNNLLGTGQYKAAANNTMDALARMRTGAAMSKSEEKFYQSLLPQAGDSQETIQAKLQQLSQAFAPYANQTIGQ
jgi:hypothetical protein